MSATAPTPLDSGRPNGAAGAVAAAGYLLLGVAGCPVLHSWSPALFHRALAAVQRPGSYLRLRAESATEALDLARALGLAGLNLTAPFKESILPWLDRLDDGARAVGAVNTVIFTGSRTVGYNTDVIGVRRMLAQACGALRGARVAVLGAGGAARAVGYVLAQQGCGEVLLVNRDPARGARAARALGLGFVPWERAGAALAGADLVIACLAPGAEVPPAWLAAVPQILSASYHGPSLPPAAGPADARQAAATWLVGQAVAGFTLMAGIEAPDVAFEAGLADVRGRPWPGPGALVLVGPPAVGRALTGLVPMPVLAVQAGDLADDDLDQAGLVVLCVEPRAPVPSPVQHLLRRSGRSVDLVLHADRAPDLLARTLAAEIAALGTLPGPPG